MKKAIMAANLIFALLLFSYQFAFAGPHRVISDDELRAMMRDGKPLTIVDVREPALFARAHVPGAINIPYPMAKTRILKELRPSERIVFVCHGGPMGDELGEILARNGYDHVFNLRGGMRHWNGPFAR